MNAKNVLNKILTLLSTDEVELTDAKAENGDILQSPTFDLDESVDVVHEDGTKSPAPDGEYTIGLTDESGNENIIRIQVKDGKIAERENVEEPKNEEDMEKPKEEVVDKDVEEKKEEDVKMADAKMEPAHALPNTTDEDPRNSIGEDTDDKKDPIIALSYRIDELEKAMKMMVEKMGGDETPVDEESPEQDELVPDSATEVAMSEEEEELPKLDGAPVETATRFSADSIHKPNYGKKVGDSQSSFLSKLYS